MNRCLFAIVFFTTFEYAFEYRKYKNTILHVYGKCCKVVQIIWQK